MTLEKWDSLLSWGGVSLLALTFVIGFFALLASNKVKDRQKLRIAELGKETADAKATAAAANERAASAEQLSSGANERAGKLELEAAQQREKAAKAERELLELQQRLAPRHLSAEQRSSLLESLSSAPHKGALTIWCSTSDMEATGFARDLQAVIDAAGWKATILAGVVFTANPTVGLELTVTQAGEPPARAFVLGRALDKCGLKVRSRTDPTFGPNDLTLTVGAK